MNDKVSFIRSFVCDLDVIIDRWKKKDFVNVVIDIMVSNLDKGFMEKLEVEYKKI